MAPRWRSLYVLAAFMLALLGVVDGAVPPGAWQRVLDVAVTMLLFLSIHAWVRANRRALAVAGVRDVDFRVVALRPDVERLRAASMAAMPPGHRMRLVRGGRGWRGSRRSSRAAS